MKPKKPKTPPKVMKAKQLARAKANQKFQAPSRGAADINAGLRISKGTMEY